MSVHALAALPLRLQGEEEHEETRAGPQRAELKAALTFLSAELCRGIRFRSLGSAEGQRSQLVSGPDGPCAGDELTLDEEEEADHAHHCDDDARDDEGQAPVGGDPVASDQGAQDVPHRGVRVPQAHDEAAPDRK